MSNPPILDVRITISVLDTAYKIDFTFLVVRLNQFQFQILFFNILDFSDFSKFFEKFLQSVSTDTDNRLYNFKFTNGVEFQEFVFKLFFKIIISILAYF